MSIIARIRRKILSGQIVFSQHVLNDKLVQFDLEQEDLLEAMLAGKVEWRGTDDPRGTVYHVACETADGLFIDVRCRFTSIQHLLIITFDEY